MAYMPRKSPGLKLKALSAGCIWVTVAGRFRQASGLGMVDEQIDHSGFLIAGRGPGRSCGEGRSPAASFRPAQRGFSDRLDDPSLLGLAMVVSVSQRKSSILNHWPYVGTHRLGPFPGSVPSAVMAGEIEIAVTIKGSPAAAERRH